MAKGAKSNLTKRKRAVKRLYMKKYLDEQINTLNKKIQLSTQGFEYREKQKPNAFLEPENPDAEFPQAEPVKIYDFRSHKNPFSGMEKGGVMTKSRPRDLIRARIYGQEYPEDEEVKEIIKPNHAEISETQMMNQLINMKFKQPMSTPALRKIKKKVRKNRGKKYKNRRGI